MLMLNVHSPMKEEKKEKNSSACLFLPFIPRKVQKSKASDGIERRAKRVAYADVNRNKRKSWQKIHRPLE